MGEVYAIQYSSYLSTAGEFLSSFINSHPDFKESNNTKTLLTTHTFLKDHGYHAQSLVTTIIVPYIHLHFRKRMIESWEHLEGFDVKLASREFDNQYKMLNDYIYEGSLSRGNESKKENIYKDFRDERLKSRHSDVKLKFVDVGRLLMYKDSEYKALIKVLDVKALTSKDLFCCNSWKDYIEQYINNQLIINRYI